jgi:hypothetical protein
MRKAIFGIASVLALTTAAYAQSGSDAKPISKVARQTSASSESTAKTRVAARSAPMQHRSAAAAEKRTDSVRGNPVDVNASAADRWLAEREGYRDGGY